MIEANLEALGVGEGEVDVVSGEASEFLRRRTKQEGGPFDIIFFDPPYATDYETVLAYVSEHSKKLLAKGGVVIVEHHRKNGLKEGFGRLKRYRVLKQGDSCLSFYEQTAA